MTAPVTDLAFERLRRLPKRDDVFELAILRLPQWIVGEGAEPYRPLMSLAVSRRQGTISDGQMARPGEPIRPLEAVSKLATHSSTRYCPSTVIVRDGALMEPLREPLASLGVALELADLLPGIDYVEADMRAHMSGRGEHDSYLDGQGVSLERVRAFAEAADRFFKAALWDHLSGEDIVVVESPAPHPGLRSFSLMGGGGMERGLAFFETPGEFERLLAADSDEAARVLSGPRWMFSGAGVHEIPLADSELWETHALPHDGPRGYPLFGRMSGGRGLQRPDATQLAWAEGLLRAVASCTEDELDAGRWRKVVRTIDGEREYVLTLPGVLESVALPPSGGDRRTAERVMADLHALIESKQFADPADVQAFVAELGGKIPHAAATTPRERALEKFYDALECSGRLRLKLTREALALYPDCADAWVLLASEMPDPDKAFELWKTALEAATRDLGPAAFKRHTGHFWSVFETRPYMRARAGLAEQLWLRDREDEAFAHWHEMLELNPGDNQGIRHILAPRLLEAGRDAEAARVAAMFPEDTGAMLQFTRALLAFRAHGAGDLASVALEEAVKANRHVLKYLAGTASSEHIERDGSYIKGHESEAALVDDGLGVVFEDTPGAVAWLRSHRRAGKKARRKKP